MGALYRAPSSGSVRRWRSFPVAIGLVWVGVQFLDLIVDDPSAVTAWSVVLRVVSLVVVAVGVGWAWRTAARPRPDPQVLQRLQRWGSRSWWGSAALRTEAARALRRGDVLTDEQRPLAAAHVAANTTLEVMTANYVAIAGTGVALVAAGTASVPLLVMMGLWSVMALGSVAGSVHLARMRRAARAQGLPVGDPTRRPRTGPPAPARPPRPARHHEPMGPPDPHPPRP